MEVCSEKLPSPPRKRTIRRRPHRAARRLGLWRSAALFVAVEVTLLFWIRDSLLLELLMLLHPIDAIKQWQFG